MECPACRTVIAPGQTFCPTCRARGGGPPMATPVDVPLARRVTAPAPPVTDKNERMFLIIACLLSAGALAIPRLLRSKAFGPVGKTVLGLGAAFNTIGAFGLIVFLILRGPALFMDYLHYVQNR